MKINIKQTLFVLAGLVLITIIFTLSKLNTAIASKENGKKFGNWVVSCSPKDEKTKAPETCLLNQQVNISQGEGENKEESPIALFQIGYFSAEKELKLIQTLPLGTSIQAGTALFNSDTLLASGRYTICLQYGCNALTVISDEVLKTLLSAKETSLVFVNSENKKMALPLSTDGLEKGLKYIK